MINRELITTAREMLALRKEQKNILIGFDGYVDEIIHVVDQRQNETEFSRIASLSGLADRISSIAGLSANMELVPMQVKLGGNGTIMANAMLAQGYNMNYIGSLGYPKIHPIFEDFVKKSDLVISLTDPGHTDALEFFDGKLMLGKMANLIEINWDNLLQKISLEELKQLITSVDFIGITNWTMLSRLNSIISGLDNILKTLDVRKTIFFDLADPQKRTSEDILEVLALMTEMQESSDVIFGMNKRESALIGALLGVNQDDIAQRAKEIRDKLSLSAVVIHPLEGAAAATEEGAFWVNGPYTSKPLLTTGAGDNFNSGFCNGWLSGLTAEQALIVGVSTSGFYVRNTYSPNREELLNFMQKWSDQEID